MKNDETRRREVVRRREAGESYFESLVVGAAADTLDDGEAATIASHPLPAPGRARDGIDR